MGEGGGVGSGVVVLRRGGQDDNDELQILFDVWQHN